MIKLTLKNIESEFKRINSDYQKEISKSHLRVSEQLEKELVTKTPIDTGLARSSWKREIKSNSIDITNNIDYIQYLNEGSSKQAPAYFIESTALKYGKPLGTIVQIQSK